MHSVCYLLPLYQYADMNLESTNIKVYSEYNRLHVTSTVLSELVYLIGQYVRDNA